MRSKLIKAKQSCAKFALHSKNCAIGRKRQNCWKNCIALDHNFLGD